MDLSPPTFRELLAFLAGVIVAIPSLIKTYREWKASDKQEQHTDAQTELARESTVSLRVRDTIATGESVGRMLTTLMDMGDKLSELQQQTFEVEQLKTRLKLSQHFNKKLKALLDFHEIKFSEADLIKLDGIQEDIEH